MVIFLNKPKKTNENNPKPLKLVFEIHVFFNVKYIFLYLCLFLRIKNYFKKL